MLITPVRKSNIIISVLCSGLFLIVESEKSSIDYFIAAELFFSAWLYVLVFLLTIMITSLIPIIRLTSNHWHKPNPSISPLSIWQEPLNCIHYLAVTMLLSAVLGAGLTALFSHNLNYPFYALATGTGLLGGINTAPLVFKGNYVGKSPQA